MRFSASFLLALPAIAAAEQIPLGDTVKSWFNKIQPQVPEPVASPVQAASAKAADLAVTPLTLDNWQSALTPSVSAESSDPEEWLILITGGNKTCHGFCDVIEKSWNKSVPLLAATQSPPHLASLNCETERVLCKALGAYPTSLWHVSLPVPAPDQSKPETPIHIVWLNRTHTEPSDFVKIHNEKVWETHSEKYEGVFHPFDGFVAQQGLTIPVGYVRFAFSLIPQWAFMLGISLFTRNFMGRRMQPQGARPGAAAGAPAAGAAPRAS
ncbi:hypothetical protein L228DRAFT_285330 [Xylona heveae TC161]|uniref:Uncharacterized protein n=1 Tax=Xylona heveae (strain CBS 132557 / TC161) TaxID=1328760 RepID=A0A165A4I3_XYLHT|nr:hypothetical protein L228DRAFT_285330 [Xylona heveae TC161]KZF19935.1 hypothetical protein L228DRAFT_285330 [Xylona heveae TC161]